MLIDSDTGNAIASNLEPDLPDFDTDVRELAIWPADPSGLKFRVSPEQHQPNLSDDGP